jgi:hypothetical protein
MRGRGWPRRGADVAVRRQRVIYLASRRRTVAGTCLLQAARAVARLSCYPCLRVLGWQ